MWAEPVAMDESPPEAGPLLPARARAEGWSIARTLARADEVEALLAQGIPPRRVEAEVAKAWGITRRMGRDYVKAIHERWTQLGKRDRASKRNEMRAKLAHVYRVSVVSPMTYNAALKAAELEAKLDGLNDDETAEQRAIARVLAVAREVFAGQPGAFAKLVEGMAKEAGRDTAALPSGVVPDGDER
jgi:hypothetical protein